MIKKILIISIIILFLMPSIYGKEMASEVTDKHIIGSNICNTRFIVHTNNFGDIRVYEYDYNNITIGDNITYDTYDFLSDNCRILKINGKEVGEYI